MKYEKLTQRNVQVSDEESSNTLKDKSPDHSSERNAESQQKLSKQFCFRPQIIKLFHSAYQHPQPWGPTVVRFMWYALNVILLLTILKVPYIHHTRIVLEGEEHREFLDYAFKSLEIAAPRSSEKLASMVPYDWTPSSTIYDYYFQGVCRKEDGKEQVCQRRNGERYLTGLIENIGAQIAEHIDDPSVSAEWSKAFRSACKIALFRIKPGMQPAAVEFLNHVENETLSTGSTFGPAGFIVLSVIDAICDLTYPPATFERKFTVFRLIIGILSIMYSAFYTLFELCPIHWYLPHESLGKTYSKGPYSRLAVWCCASKLVYYVAAFWNQIALFEWMLKETNEGPHTAQATRRSTFRRH